MCRRTRAPLRILRRPRRCPSPLRQADRRDRQRPAGRAHPPRGAGARERRRRSRAARRACDRRARAGAFLRRGAAFAVDRHCRQPPVHAGAGRRCAGRRRGVRVRKPGHPRHRGSRRHRARDRRRRIDDPAHAQRRQLRGPRRPARSRLDRRRARARHSAGLPVQGQLLSPGRALAIFAAGLSDPRGRRARRPRDPRPRGPGALRTRRRMDRCDRLRGRSRARRALLSRHSPLLAGPARRRAGPRLRGHPPQDPGTGRARARISSSRARTTTALRGWSTCSASSRRGSPPRSPLPSTRSGNCARPAEGARHGVAPVEQGEGGIQAASNEGRRAGRTRAERG